MNELTPILSLLGGLSAAFTFLWNIQDRAKKQGESNQKLDALIFAVHEIKSELEKAKDEIILLKEKIRIQDYELKDLRAALRENAGKNE